MIRAGIATFFSTALLLAAGALSAQPLSGVDGLGRVLPGYEEVGGPKEGKHVAMFYFLWHGDGTSPHRWDLHKIINSHPEVLNDFDNPHWGGGGMYYWAEPIYGYYRADDYWVHLRSMQLLSDAGVDMVVIDATNRLTYPKQADALMKAMDALRAQGRKPPKIVFYTNTASGETMQEVYDNFYKEGAPYRHPECWFYLEGKPLVIGHSKEAEGTDYRKFFTIRESQWPNEPQKVNGWPWISFTRPQKVHYNHKGEAEIINVSVAQHPNPTAGMGGAAFYGNTDNWGRSYRDGSPGNPVADIIHGYNFQEQWDFALKQDVPFIYVTGWNEWVAGKFASHDDNPEHSWFCDQASPEYSRDIEPTRTAGIQDHYYMQLVSNIRKYKGVAANPPLGKPLAIRRMDDWKKVKVLYRDYTGDTRERNHPGAQSEPPTVYTNKTGRNDFDLLKVARDEENVYFYAQTVDPLSPSEGSNWMRLYLDADNDPATGWNGYDFRINGGNSLEQYSGGTWKETAKTTYLAEGDQLMITVPRKLIPAFAGELNFEFKWSDNMQDDKDPLDWYINGDAAPGGRFNFMVNE
ncbi:hypothetical protein EDD80_10738 [Anseongella ginsenosidimutans]|uniref:Glycosyl hydrolase family 71 n=1 Tax=Anseongella ginsenosidimutans TaxID=496056 RepID=A0A4R3KS41_9SPHI|nr:hypothetical protein [Anseongella ginsenosidimutans]QEC52588.1 hypothetical protein FRZ59_09730 [Anseongella ginsenosidimutans]TCS86505.1 hypothetical protein EDD80_10738 [Anseongella ginsenosidimutans]